MLNSSHLMSSFYRLLELFCAFNLLVVTGSSHVLEQCWLFPLYLLTSFVILKFCFDILLFLRFLFPYQFSFRMRACLFSFVNGSNSFGSLSCACLQPILQMSIFLVLMVACLPYICGHLCVHMGLVEYVDKWLWNSASHDKVTFNNIVIKGQMDQFISIPSYY